MAKVLVADDRFTNREFLKTLLSYGDHQLLEAADGAEALAQVRDEHPDLVITDVLMPVMDGYEFVRQLRTDPQISATPVIFYTASYHEREARTLAESCGVHHLIFKPAEPGQILATVAQALGTAPAMEEMGPPPEFDREHLRLLTDKLSLNVNALEASNQRLSELLEVSRILAAEHDPELLLDKFCPAVRELIGARFAFIGVLSADHQSLKHLSVSGLDAVGVTRLDRRRIDREIPRLFGERDGPVRLADVSREKWNAGLPAAHGKARSFLGVKLTTSSGPYGLLWALEKLGGGEFSEQDERVLVSLVEQAGVAYENTQRYGEIQHYAAELEDRVKERTAKLTEANKDLEAFSYSVSHDLRAPLTVIKGFSSLLKENQAVALDDKSQSQVRRIDEAARKMSALIDDLLRFSRTSLAETTFTNVDLGQLVESIVAELDLEEKGRNIIWKKGALPVVQGDAAMLYQVLVNLLANALKYTRPRACAEIEIGCHRQTGPDVEIFVRDNGVGFDPRSADRLFGVFQRLHRDDEFEGTGIGLANVRRIVERHNGRTWAESRLGEGATFYFTLPNVKQKSVSAAR